MYADTVRAWVTELQHLDRAVDDAARIDLIRALEALTCAAAGAQAVTTADFDASQRAEQAARGVPAARLGRGVAAQIALARRESPHRGQRHVGLAVVLRDELPGTLSAFRAGWITEWKATLVARETACLSLADRRTIDHELSRDPDRLERMGEGELVGEISRRACTLDPASVATRRSRAETERRVSLRPAPDVMSQLSALLPVKDGVAVYAVLTREADRLRAAGDARSRGQIMADTLVDRVLSDPLRQRGRRPGVVIHVVVSDEVLLGGAAGAGELDGYGPVPADLVRELAESERSWVRRLYACPATGALMAMDSQARLFPRALAQVLRLRDRRCRTPWCDAPVRQADHVQSADVGGPTSLDNGQGLCEACNHAKQALGWHAQPRPGPRHSVRTTTPTGHSYDSTAPPLRQSVWNEAGPGRWVLAS